VIRILIGLLLVIGAVYLWNASWRVPTLEGEMLLIAHRGVHQTYAREGLDNETCTAERIQPPTHQYLENTIPSMRAAFAVGADIVELDLHPTTDGHFAVFHDWTVDCRTEGSGETRAHSLAELKALDIGYGYTADDGKTFPFRGTATGSMPSLTEVLEAIPDGRFLVDFKSNEAREGDMLAALLAAEPQRRAAIWGAYGGDRPAFRAAETIDGRSAFSRRRVIDCLLQYLGLGWSGYVPAACRDTQVLVPINAAPLLWGWPNLFLRRLSDAGSEVVLTGPYSPGDPGTAGIDSLETLAMVPADFTGYLWTNRIELIGPALETP
jgi:glycerophosphoryl diester phosphodiesterase